MVLFKGIQNTLYIFAVLPIQIKIRRFYQKEDNFSLFKKKKLIVTTDAPLRSGLKRLIWS